MTRYFEVNVTGCKDCPYARRKQQYCNIPMTSVGAERVYAENKDQLTDSCPMAAQHKESEPK